MSQVTHLLHRRRNQVIIVGACILFAMALTQCRSVTDNVLAVGTTAADRDDREGNHGRCIEKCAEAAEDSLEAEDDLHEHNVHACRGDKVCREAEHARHKAAEARIREFRKKCQNNCHHQGGGHGGR